MRELIIEKIEELKKKEGGFNRSMMRWKNFKFEKDYAEDVDFKHLDDSNLFDFYNGIYRQCCKPM